ncbi:MAG TPA: rhodanese-like domain-containing protein [Desulfocapsa sulfexigens]|nr:rhodanese-like domain-containing protein [Desulfocapsa sulfexigens]
MKKVTQVLSVLIVMVLLVQVSFTEAKGTCPVKKSTLVESNNKTPQISTEELREILTVNNATVLDARPFKEIAISHIPGSLNLAAKPGVEKAVYISDAKEVDRIVLGQKKALIALYCNGI